MTAAKGIIIAGTHSGCGKTTLSLALLSAFRKRGLRVAPFKVGPDFIDPGHHARMAGASCRNLDGWMLSKDYNVDSFRRHAAGADIALVEGVMGLFDGRDGKSESGSTAEMAKWLDLPVILVVDARSMARSAAALVKGFETFDPELRFAGAVFNRIGSPRHLSFLQEALEGNVRIPCLGGIPKEDVVSIPERHLGLFTDQDNPLSEAAVSALARIAEERIDLDRLFSALPEIPPPSSAASAAHPVRKARIAVARDNAFCFYYPDNLELLEAGGAELVFFSPVAGETLPPDIDGIYLGGGYPELYAETLARNAALRTGIREASRSGMPIYAECGGFMYLCSELEDAKGKRYPMAGCFPFVTRMLSRLKRLGYREVALDRETILGPVGATLRGHEFHYSELLEPGGAQTVYRVANGSGAAGESEGFQVKRTLGSYIHLHFGSRPEAAARLVDECLRYRGERKTHETG
jgi:cobyrinic acid a,c-diamide synthase